MSSGKEMIYPFIMFIQTSWMWRNHGYRGSK